MASKDIKLLSDAEHIRRRPEMYVGSVDPSEEKVPIFDGDVIKYEKRLISIGMYKIFDEVVDNAYDEAKRQKGGMQQIDIEIDTDSNKVSVTDDGGGFKDAHKEHPKTGVSNVETAVSFLRAGSNFDNDASDESLIGMHGVGVSCTNVLSKYFYILTKEKGSYKSVRQTWENFVPVGELDVRKKRKTSHGTTISFIPDDEIFGDLSWDVDYIRTMLIMKNHVIRTNKDIKNLKLTLTVDGEEVSTDENIFPKGTVRVNTKLGMIALLPPYDDGKDISFLNSARCSGIHQHIFKQHIGDLHDYKFAYKHMHIFMFINLPPDKVKFSDQNKTRLATRRRDIEEPLMKAFKRKFNRKYKKSDLFEQVASSIDDEKNKKQLKKIKKKKRSVKRVRLSDKYLPAANMRGRTDIFISEGLSAGGSISQKRDSKSQAVYMLKGKPKNVRDISSLQNKEFIELMNILKLDPTKPDKDTRFSRVIMATDADGDGMHIQGLLINFFYRYFPEVIRKGKLFALNAPIGICTYKGNQKYFYDLDKYRKFVSNNKVSDYKYAKGLGSYSMRDWDYIMDNMKLDEIAIDKHAGSAINLAFGKDSQYRKDWLMGRTKIKDIPNIKSA